MIVYLFFERFTNFETVKWILTFRATVSRWRRAPRLTRRLSVQLKTFLKVIHERARKDSPKNIAVPPKVFIAFIKPGSHCTVSDITQHTISRSTWYGTILNSIKIRITAVNRQTLNGEFLNPNLRFARSAQEITFPRGLQQKLWNFDVRRLKHCEQEDTRPQIFVKMMVSSTSVTDHKKIQPRSSTFCLAEVESSEPNSRDQES